MWVSVYINYQLIRILLLIKALQTKESLFWVTDGKIMSAKKIIYYCEVD